MVSGDLITINFNSASNYPNLRFCLVIQVNYINEKAKKRRRDNWSQWAELTILYQGELENISLYWDDEVKVL